MSGHDMITNGASAGGLKALAGLVRGLPVDLPASVFVATQGNSLPPMPPTVGPEGEPG